MGNYHGKNSFDSFSHKKGCVIKKQAMESFNRYSIFFFYIRPCFSIDQRGGTESAYFKTLQLQVICLNKKCSDILSTWMFRSSHVFYMLLIILVLFLSIITITIITIIILLYYHYYHHYHYYYLIIL